MDLLEFCKCYAGIFHDPKSEPTRPLTEPGGVRHDGEFGLEDDSGAVAEWARALGRPEILRMEQAFRARSVPFRSARGGSSRRDDSYSSPDAAAVARVDALLDGAKREE